MLFLVSFTVFSTVCFTSPTLTTVAFNITPLGRLQYKHVEPIAGFQKSVKKIVYPPLKQCEKMFYPPLNKVKIILYPPSPPLLQKIFLSDFLGPKCLYYKLSI